MNKRMAGLLTGFFLLLMPYLYAQENAVKKKDILDVVFPKKRAKADTGEDSLRIKHLYLSLLPIPGYSPSMGAVLGAGASATMLTGNRLTTSISSGLANVTVTSRKQLNINIRSAVYLRDNSWIFQGDWRLLLFAQPTYGLGINFSDRGRFSWNGLDVNRASNEQPMRFNYIRFYENVYKKIRPSLYGGIGINVDYHYAIQDQSLDTSLPGIVLTSHFNYSVKNQFPLNKYTSAGLSFNLLYESRDNPVNPLKGHFAQLSFRVNPEFLGSTRYNSTLYYEYRTYIPLTKKLYNKQILALWTWGQFLTGGVQPYLGLPAIGWDTYNRSGRGYIQGRIRGEHFLYGEAEYRFPLLKSGLLGGTVFLNTTTASNNAIDQKLASKFVAGYGAGLRVKLSKQTNTNIAIDYGIGKNGSSGIYFNITECF